MLATAQWTWLAIQM